MNEELMVERDNVSLFSSNFEEEKSAEPLIEEKSAEPLIDMSAVFVDETHSFPVWDGQRSRAEVCKMLLEVNVLKVLPRLADLGYPQQDIRYFERLWSHSGAEGYKAVISRNEMYSAQRRSKTFERVPKSLGIQARYSTVEKGSGRVGTDWRVPTFSSPKVSKPATYFRGTFRAWAHSEAWTLSKTIVRKTQYVTGNLAAQACYYGSRSADWLLHKAVFYVDDYTWRGSVPPRLPQLGDFLTPIQKAYVHAVAKRKSVTVYGIEYFGPSDELRGVLGPKNKIYFVLCEAYLTNTQFKGEPVNGDQLCATLAAKFPKATAYQLSAYLSRTKTESNPDDFIEPLPAASGVKPPMPLPEVLARTTRLVNRAERSRKRRTVGDEVWLMLRRREMVLDRPMGMPFDVDPVVWSKANRRTRIHYQGAAPSKVVNNLGRSVALDFLKEHEQDFAQLAALFGALCIEGSIANKLASVIQFIAGNATLYPLFRNRVMQFFQGLDAISEQVAYLWELVVTSGVVISLRAVFSEMTDFILSPLRDFIRGELKTTFLRTTAQSISTAVVDAIKEAIRRVQESIRLRSFAPLWGPAWDPTKWIAYASGMVNHRSVICTAGDSRAADLVAHAKLLATGAIPVWWTTPVSRTEYVAHLERHIEDGIRLAKYFKSTTSLSRDIQKGVNLLRQTLEGEETSDYAGRSRMRPFFMVVYGRPGQGKTNAMDPIIRAVAEKRKWDTSAAGSYSWVPNANFQTGLDRQWCVTFNDVDHGTAPPTAGVDSHINSLCKLVDNSPYPVEEAEAQKKGKTYAWPMLVTYITNHFNCAVKGKTTCPDAFWRRINLHVEFTIKKEFANSEHKCDHDKMKESWTHDMYDISVRRYKEQTSLEIPSLGAPVSISYPELLVLIHTEMDKHLSRELDLRKNRGYDGEFCPQCYLPRNKDCGHKELVYQGAASSKPVVELEEEEEEDFVPTWTEVLAESVRCRRQTVVGKLESLRSSISVSTDAFTKVAFVGCAAAGFALGLCVTQISKLEMQARENNSSGSTPQNWLRADNTYPTGLPQNPSRVTYTKEQVAEALKKSFVTVTGPKVTTFGQVIGHNTILVPTHVIGGGHSITVAFGSRTIIVEVDEFSSCVNSMQRELTMVKVPDLSCRSVITPYLFTERDHGISQFDEVELWGPTGLEQVASQNSVRLGPKGTDIRVVFPQGTEDGDCGKVYVALVGKAWRIVGMHYALETSIAPFKSYVRSVAGFFCKEDIRSACVQLATTYQGVVTLNRFITRGNAVSFSTLPMVSEVDSARAHGAVVDVVGVMDPRPTGQTMKSKVTKSLIHDDCFPLTSKWCRSDKPYWVLPDFRGHMVDGKWVSPFTNCFQAENKARPSQYLLMAAIADYLTGLEDLDPSGFRGLSEEETLSGCPGSVIGGFEVKTSVGPPYSRPKRDFMLLCPGESYVSDELWSQIDEATEWEATDIVAPFGVCVPKDEALRVGKIPRIFINLPFTFNFKLKMKMGATIAFIRANPFFFECMVGINMTSLESDQVVRFLRRKSQSCVDEDTRMMDKGWSPLLWDAVALVIFRLVQFVEGDKAAFEALSYVWGLKYCYYVMKGDVFHAWWNPSGNWLTVLVNSLLISLGERYLFYKYDMPPPSKAAVLAFQNNFFARSIVEIDEPFRQFVALSTYGDDALRSSSLPVAPNHGERWHQELGLDVTDGGKNATVQEVRLEDVTFLKRSFVLDEELDCFVARLSLKSLSRTLLIKKESSLSLADHAATAISEVLRELAYYGEPMYEKTRSYLDSVAAKHHLLDNSMYVSRPYSFWRAKMMERTFSAWAMEREPQFTEGRWIRVGICKYRWESSSSGSSLFQDNE